MGWKIREIHKGSAEWEDMTRHANEQLEKRLWTIDPVFMGGDVENYDGYVSGNGTVKCESELPFKIDPKALTGDQNAPLVTGPGLTQDGLDKLMAELQVYYMSQTLRGRFLVRLGKIVLWFKRRMK